MEALPPARHVLGRGRGAGSLPALFASGVTAGRAGWVGDGPVGLGLGGQPRWLQVEDALAPLPTSPLCFLLSPMAQLRSSVFAGVLSDELHNQDSFLKPGRRTNPEQLITAISPHF